MTLTATPALVERVVARTVEIAAIAAPPLDEADRTSLVQRWWTADGLEEVAVDRVGNVWARIRPGARVVARAEPAAASAAAVAAEPAAGTGAGAGAAAPARPAVVIAAHLDTVFGRDVAHGAVGDGRYLRGPSVGDDSIALASLSALAELLPADMAVPVWILATVGEEGLGNLIGITTALAEPRTPVATLVALEGNWLGRVCHTAVGSVRWRVTITGPGGHAWERADAPSAVHTAARAIDALVGITRPTGARTAINVGRMGGGESINSRAISAWFEVDLRADSQAALDALDATVRQAISGAIATDNTDNTGTADTADTADTPGGTGGTGGTGTTSTGTTDTDAAGRAQVTATFDEIGRRPAGHLAVDHPIVAAAADALRAAGRTVTYTAASTDANAAHRIGIPAVAIGVTIGEGEHTEAEWIDLEPVAEGLCVLADTVIRIAATLGANP